MRIASGVYHYKLGIRDTLVRESWTIERQNGQEIVKVLRDAAAFQSKLSSEIVLEKGKIIGQTINWENANPKHVQKAKASYKVTGQALEIEREIDGKPYSETLTMQQDTILSSLMRVTVGLILKQLLQFPAGSSLIVPNILRADDSVNILGAHIENRQAKLLSNEPIDAGGKLYQAKCFSYTGDLYDDSARFWIDKHDILLRYTWKQADGMAWDVQLHNYERMKESE
jgi:hypothetical protein